MNGLPVDMNLQQLIESSDESKEAIKKMTKLEAGWNQFPAKVFTVPIIEDGEIKKMNLFPNIAEDQLGKPIEIKRIQTNKMFQHNSDNDGLKIINIPGLKCLSWQEIEDEGKSRTYTITQLGDSYYLNMLGTVGNRTAFVPLYKLEKDGKMLWVRPSPLPTSGAHRYTPPYPITGSDG